MTGSPREVIAHYQTAVDSFKPATSNEVMANQEKLAEVRSLKFQDASGQETAVVHTGEPFLARLDFVAHAPLDDVVFELFFYSAEGEEQCQFTTEVSGERIRLEPGAGTIEFSGAGLSLLPGIYYTDVVIKERGTPKFYDWTQFNFTALRVDPGKMIRGKYYMPHEWRLVQNGRCDEAVEAEAANKVASQI